MPQCTKLEHNVHRSTKYIVHNINNAQNPTTQNLVLITRTIIRKPQMSISWTFAHLHHVHKIIIFHCNISTKILPRQERNTYFVGRTTRFSCIDLTLTIPFNYLVNHYKHLVQSSINSILDWEPIRNSGPRDLIHWPIPLSWAKCHYKPIRVELVQSTRK